MCWGMSTCSNMTFDKRNAAAVWLLWLLAVRCVQAEAAAAASAMRLPLATPAGLPTAVVAAGGGAVAALNDRLTVAAIVTDSSQGAAAGLRILRRNGRAWQAAGAIEAPPDADAATFGQAGLAMSSDGRVLVAAAAAARPCGCEQRAGISGSNVTLGYIYGPVAHPTDVLTYALTHRLSVDVRAAGAGTCAASSQAPQCAAMIQPKFDLSRGGQAVVVCYTVQQPLPASQQQGVPGGGGGGFSSTSSSRSGGAAVFSVPADPRQQATTHVLPVPRGSQGFGSDCKASQDGRVVLVADAAQGAMVYSRQAHTSAAAAPHRASGWLPGGAPSTRYHVLAAALSPSGTRAALAVQPAAPPGGDARKTPVLLRVFAADALGAWTQASVCDIAVAVEVEDASQLVAPGSSSDSAGRSGGGAAGAPGDVLLSLTDVAAGGSVHVTVGGAAQPGVRSTYLVGLRGTQATHCPQLPVMRGGALDVAVAAAAADSGSGSLTRPTPADGGHSGGARRGRLHVGGASHQGSFFMSLS